MQNVCLDSTSLPKGDAKSKRMYAQFMSLQIKIVNSTENLVK